MQSWPTDSPTEVSRSFLYKPEAQAKANPSFAPQACSEVVRAGAARVSEPVGHLWSWPTDWLRVDQLVNTGRNQDDQGGEVIRPLWYARVYEHPTGYPD